MVQLSLRPPKTRDLREALSDGHGIEKHFLVSKYCDFPEGRLSDSRVYARVSPGGKSESVDAQTRRPTKAGCKKVFRDMHVSRAKADRAQLRRVIETLEPGDVLMVTRLDRLARSTRDLLNTPRCHHRQEGRIPLARRHLGRHHHIPSHGRLMLTVLGGLAEFERDLIRARTGEGCERARSRGAKMGRKPKLTAHQRQEAIKRRDRGEPLREIARSCTVSHPTISARWHRPLCI
jgi:DNA invertase Pin-like site-specific DNA recombinase